MTELELSAAIEDLLVARNLRHMQTAQAALEPGYYLRGAKLLWPNLQRVIVATGFPVVDTYETDGPVGAIALYRALQSLGAKPILACASPLAAALAKDYEVLELRARDWDSAEGEALENLSALQPSAIVSIERPGRAADGRYYNMRGEDISPRCGIFDSYMQLSHCPTIAIGDGGNEIGMGNINDTIATLDINPSVTGCDELLVADVSNWGAYGLIAFLQIWSGKPLLAAVSPATVLRYLSQAGSVDGVTRENTLTEDGLALTEGESVLQQLSQLCQDFADEQLNGEKLA